MKKILFSAAALLTMLFAASCQKEDFSGADGEFATVTLTVQAPASPSTKALGDGTKAKNLVFGVFDENGAELTDLRQGDWMNANQTEITFNDQLQAKVTVNLAKGKTYTFICWAQTKEYGDATNPTAVTCYDFKNLDDIKVDYTVNNEANNEHRDAFYACVTSGIIKKDYSTTITLTRPFGQLNIGTEDMAAAESAGLDLANLWVELSVTNCPTHLVADMDKHVYTVDGSVTAKFTKALCPASVNSAETLNVDLDGDKAFAENEKFGWLSMNYIFTAHQEVKDDATKNITFDLYEGDLSLAKYSRDNVPFIANYRTNLLGRLLTTDGDITVIIDPVPDGDENITGGIEDVSVITLDELNAVTAAGTYNVGGTLTKDGVKSAAMGAGYEDVEIKDADNNTATYTLKVPSTKADGEYEAYYKAGGYLIVAVDAAVAEDGKVTLKAKDTHVAYVPEGIEDEEEEEPALKATLAVDPATIALDKADAATVEFTVTAENCTWTATCDNENVEVKIAENVVNVTVPANEDTENEATYVVTVTPAVEEGVETCEHVTVKITQAKKEAAVEPEEPAKTVTVAEFLAAAEDDTMYQLTGVITRVTNTTYGNFDLTDETGTVYIYGLCSPEGVQKYWAESGAKIGDTITIQTVRTSHNGSPQGKDALFVELVPFVETASEWGIAGDLTNWGESADIVMYNTWKADNLFVAYNVEITSGAFKIRANNEWNDAKNYGLAAAGKIYADRYYTLTNGAGSQNATPMAYGTYDVYFDLANERVALITPGKEYADAADGGDPVVVIEGLKDHEWGVIGSFAASNWETDVVMEVVGDWAIAKNVALAKGNTFKFRANKSWDAPNPNYGSGCDVNVGETYTTYENGGDMKFVGEDGAYNIYFSLVDAKFYMEKYTSETTVTFNVADYEFENQAPLDSYTVGDVTIAFAAGGNNNSPKYYTSGTAVRCYPKNTITVSGKNIKKIEVVAPDGYTNAIDLYYETTKLDNFTWEGSSEEVVLTFDPNKTSGQSRFVKINVTYE